MIHAKQQIKELEEELQDMNQQYLEALKERDTAKERIEEGKKTLSQFEAVVKKEVDKCMAQERKQKKDLEKKYETLKRDYDMLEETR